MTAEDLDDEEMDDSKADDDNDVGDGEPGGKARKRKERLEQNRISARESRKRKKTMIEELQRTVITLSRENKELNERNEQLRRQLMEIGAKVRSRRDASCFPLYRAVMVTLFACVTSFLPLSTSTLSKTPT
jgi:hypothetical protein